MKLKVLKYSGPRQAEIVESEIASLKDNQALAKTIVSNVSAGTEMAFYRGTAPQLNSRMRDDGLWEDVPGAISYPMQSDGEGVWWMGYAAVSEIIEVGGEMNDLKVGDIVFTYGAHKEYQIIEAGGYFKVPEYLTPEQASFTTLTEIAFNSILDSAIKLMDNVVIIGLGTLGQLSLQMCKLSGAQVISADFLDNRLRLASQLGADNIINPKTAGDLAENVIKIFGERADIVIEVTGNSKALADAVRCVRNEGQVTVVSFYQSPPDIQMGREFHHNRIVIRSSQIGGINPVLRAQYDNRAKRARTAMNLIGKMNVDALISHKCKFDEYPKMLKTIDENPSDCQSVIIEY